MAKRISSLPNPSASPRASRMLMLKCTLLTSHSLTLTKRHLECHAVLNPSYRWESIIIWRICHLFLLSSPPQRLSTVSNMRGTSKRHQSSNAYPSPRFPCGLYLQVIDDSRTISTSQQMLPTSTTVDPEVENGEEMEKEVERRFWWRAEDFDKGMRDWIEGGMSVMCSIRPRRCKVTLSNAGLILC